MDRKTWREFDESDDGEAGYEALMIEARGSYDK